MPLMGLQPLTGSADVVDSVAFSANGTTLATASADGTVRLWALDVDQAIRRVCATTRIFLPLET